MILESFVTANHTEGGFQVVNPFGETIPVQSELSRFLRIWHVNIAFHTCRICFHSLKYMFQHVFARARSPVAPAYHWPKALSRRHP